MLTSTPQRSHAPRIRVPGSHVPVRPLRFWAALHVAVRPRIHVSVRPRGRAEAYRTCTYRALDHTGGGWAAAYTRGRPFVVEPLHGRLRGPPPPEEGAEEGAGEGRASAMETEMMPVSERSTGDDCV